MGGALFDFRIPGGTRSLVSSMISSSSSSSSIMIVLPLLDMVPNVDEPKVFPRPSVERDRESQLLGSIGWRALEVEINRSCGREGEEL